MMQPDETLCVGVVIFDEDKVLLVQKKNHSAVLWQLPGGQIEGDESLSEGAVRELAETTTLRTEEQNLSLLPEEWRATMTRDYGERNLLFRGFACSRYDGAPKETEKTAYKWAPIAELDATDLVPNTLDVIKSAQQHFAMMN